MRKIAQFAGGIVRWGGGGGALLGAILFVIYLSAAIVSDILRVGGWPYYDWSLTLFYIVIGLLFSALLGFIFGIVGALLNSAAMALLIAALRLRRKSANIPRRALTFTFILVSGLGTFAFFARYHVISWTTTWSPEDWLLGAIIPAILAACWAWRVGGKAPIIALQT
jgi:hypothetical protein